MPTRPLSTPYLIGLGALGSWAAFNGIVFAFDSAKRYRAESAWFLFVAALAIVAIIHTGKNRPDTRTSAAPLWLAFAPAVVALLSALVLFYPALSVGLLSDDFVLLDRAQRGVLADASWDYLRPLPLALWRLMALDGVGAAVPWRLHVFNVALHGFNAALVAILATRLGLTRREACLAGVLFLVFPGAAEPVVWASGVFDVTVMAFLLMACIAITMPPGVAQYTAIAAITIGALGSKELGAVLPVLMIVIAWASPQTTVRQALVSASLSLAIVAAYLVIRRAGGFPSAPPAVLSGYAVKELFSRPFGFLGLPFHANVLAMFPWLAAVFALVWPVMLVGTARRGWALDGNARLPIALALWTLVTIAPLASMLFVGEDLQSSRYLYPGAAAWAIITVVVLRWLPGPLPMVVGGALIVVAIVGLRAHLEPWMAAAAERDHVLAGFRDANLGCRPTTAAGIPDHVQGAYVFRNGFAEAVAMQSPGAADPCAVEWSNGGFRRTDSPRP